MLVHLICNQISFRVVVGGGEKLPACVHFLELVDTKWTKSLTTINWVKMKKGGLEVLALKSLPTI